MRQIYFSDGKQIEDGHKSVPGKLAVSHAEELYRKRNDMVCKKKGRIMKRIISVILLAAILLAGCGTPEDHRMRKIECTANYAILVDTDTGVCYLHTPHGGLCVMVDHNGNPYIANGWRDWGGDDDR